MSKDPMIGLQEETWRATERIGSALDATRLARRGLSQADALVLWRSNRAIVALDALSQAIAAARRAAVDPEASKVLVEEDDES
jgi:cytochrome P450